MTVALAQPHTATDIFLSAGIPGGYGWLFPKGEVANVGAGVDAAQGGELKAILDALLARLGARVDPRPLALTGGAIPVGGLVKPWGSLGDALVLLAGDAAGLCNPITGAGIAAAVRSGTLAGEYGGAAADGDRAACLDYEDEIEETFGAALARASRRRQELAAGRPDRAALRRAWIAYPEYWQGEPR